MADNVTLSGTNKIIAAKDVNGVEYQIMLSANGTYAIINPATSDKQDTLLTELQKKADLTETQPVSNTVLTNAVDGATTDLKVILHEHHEIHAGDHYCYYDSVTLGVSGTQVYLFTTPDTTKWIHLTFVATGSAITTVDLYEGSNKVGTTLQTVVNSNRNSLNAAGLVIHKAVTGGDTDGTKIFTISSGAASQQSRIGVSAERGHEFVLKQNTKYLLRITSATASNLTNLQLNWYEHTDV